MEACQSSYLNPQPVPPRTIAARRIAPATEPIMILVPLGPVGAESAIKEKKKTAFESAEYWKTEILSFIVENMWLWDHKKWSVMPLITMIYVIVVIVQFWHINKTDIFL